MRKQILFQITLTALFISTVSILTVKAQTITYNSNPTYHQATTPYGFIKLGPVNASWAHFVTDRPKFYFNKGVTVNSGNISSYDENLSLQTQGSTKMTILKSNGNIGIGKTAPIAKLDVHGRASCQTSFTVGTHSDNYRGLVVDNGASYGWRLMELKNVNGTQMVVKGNGYVGIGTDSPENALDVVGTIRAEECLIETGWADFVFDDDYELPSLEEEQAHINQKGHLIGFESEEEMQGLISMGNITKRQQQKIEELVLHTIDLNEQVKSLLKENTELSKKYANLETLVNDLKAQIQK